MSYDCLKVEKITLKNITFLCSYTYEYICTQINNNSELSVCRVIFIFNIDHVYTLKNDNHMIDNA